MNILITPWDYPRYIASDLLYNESIKKLKKHVYKNKFRARRERTGFPDHVTMTPKNARPERPWYSVHQCLDEKCSVHPGTLKLTDVTEASKEAGKYSGFLCSYLKDRIDISRYPFYRRSIECYKSSFNKQRSGIRTAKFRLGIWHDPTCIQCEQKELHCVRWLQGIPQVDDDILLADIADIFHKYRYVFYPNYVLGPSSMNKNVSNDIAEDSNTKKNPEMVYTPDYQRLSCYHAKLNFERDLSASGSTRADSRAKVVRYTPSQNHDVSLPHFSRQNTAMDSPFQVHKSVSSYIPSPYEQGHTSFWSAGSSPFWTSHRQPIQNSTHTYDTMCYPTSRTPTTPGKQYVTIPFRNQQYTTPQTQPFYFDCGKNSITSVPRNASPFNPRYPANWSPTFVPISMLYRNNQSYWPHAQWTSTFIPAHSANELREVQVGSIDYNQHKRDRDFDFDIEDPLTTFDTDYGKGYTETLRSELVYESYPTYWHSEKTYVNSHRYNDGSSNFDNYSFISSYDSEKNKRQGNGYRGYCKRQNCSPVEKYPKRRKTSNDDSHSLKRSHSRARNLNKSYGSTTSWRRKKEAERKEEAREASKRERKRYAPQDRTSRSYRRSFQKSHSRECSLSPKIPQVASTVMLVHKEPRPKSKRDRRK